MAVAPRGTISTSSAGNAVKSITLNVPATVVDGDELVAVIHIQNTAPVPTPPGGWTLVDSRSDATASGQLFAYRRLASSEPASYTWTTSANGRLLGFLRAYQGNNPASATFGSSQANASSTTVTAPSQTTPTANSMLIFIGSEYLTDAISESGYTSPLVEISDLVSAQFGQESAWAEGVQASAGASGSKTSTLTGANANIGMLLVVPAPPPPGGSIRRRPYRFFNRPRRY